MSIDMSRTTSIVLGTSYRCAMSNGNIETGLNHCPPAPQVADLEWLDYAPNTRSDPMDTRFPQKPFILKRARQGRYVV